MVNLREAIERIIAECAKHEDCNRCSLRTRDGGCEISEAHPYEWSLKEIEDFPARVFK